MDLLKRIVRSAGRLDALITDALQFHKAIREEITLSPISPAKLLRGMLESYPQFHPPLAEITLHGEIPMVMANEAALTQCFSNLLNNAVKFVQPGKLPRVSIRAENIQAPTPVSEGAGAPQSASYVRLWFEDNGIGIAKNHQDLIWTLFERLGHGHDGTGIGLALVQKLVQRMKGQVGVVSEPGQGSRFWLDLQKVEN